MIARQLNIGKEKIPGRITVVYGPRRVGKTTLVNEYLKTARGKKLIVSSDDINVQTVLSSQDTKKINDFAAGYDFIFIDEAQRIENVGLNLKILIDNNPAKTIIASGSASFDLSNKIGEPLTGRQTPLLLLPISVGEAGSGKNRFETDAALEEYLLYGMYPEVLTTNSKNQKIEILSELVSGYLLKDALELERVKSPKLLLDLLKLLAFQIGSEVSHTELAGSLKIDQKTVSRYLDILEKCFIIYNLRGFSRNLRNEIKKTGKYYFYDIGIRNALIGNFNETALRSDIGGLFENFVFMEKLKSNTYKKSWANLYFWRIHERQEIDLIEEKDGHLSAYEIKWSENKKVKPPGKWQAAYGDISTFEVVNRANFLDIL